MTRDRGQASRALESGRPDDKGRRRLVSVICEVLTLVAGADLAQVIERVNSGAMPVVPVYADGVRAYRFNGVHFQSRLIHLEGILGR